jgi:hypothetical protein
MTTRTQIDHANPQAVLGTVDSWKKSAKDMLDRADTYRQARHRPVALRARAFMGCGLEQDPRRLGADPRGW